MWRTGPRFCNLICSCGWPGQESMQSSGCKLHTDWDYSAVTDTRSDQMATGMTEMIPLKCYVYILQQNTFWERESREGIILNHSVSYIKWIHSCTNCSFYFWMTPYLPIPQKMLDWGPETSHLLSPLHVWLICCRLSLHVTFIWHCRLKVFTFITTT